VGKKTVAIGSVEAFGALGTRDLGKCWCCLRVQPRWQFKLHADSFSAPDLDRWPGRARGQAGSSGLLRRCSAAVTGQARLQAISCGLWMRRGSHVDEFDLEKLKLKQVRAQASLMTCICVYKMARHMPRNFAGQLVRSIWPKPVYELKLQAGGLNLAQVPLAEKCRSRDRDSRRKKFGTENRRRGT